MSRLRRALLCVLPVAILSTSSGAVPVSAHNAGHIMFPDGRCLNVGSGKDAPLVGPGAPQNALGQLDLIYDPKNGIDTSDQYGARFAATRGNSRLLPGDCPTA